MKRREDEEYEGGKESEMKEETFKKFIFYSNKVKSVDRRRDGGQSETVKRRGKAAGHKWEARGVGGGQLYGCCYAEM